MFPPHVGCSMKGEPLDIRRERELIEEQEPDLPVDEDTEGDC